MFFRKKHNKIIRDKLINRKHILIENIKSNLESEINNYLSDITSESIKAVYFSQLQWLINDKLDKVLNEEMINLENNLLV